MNEEDFIAALVEEIASQPADDWNTDPGYEWDWQGGMEPTRPHSTTPAYQWQLPSRAEAIEYLLSGDHVDRPTPNIEEDS